MPKFQIITHNFDIIIVGSGAAGLKAAIEAKKSGAKNVAIISKVIPTNSHTVAAKGGINAALGNKIEDDWRFHFYDTIKGADGLADEDAVEILCQNAARAIIELEKIGVVFSRDENGAIAQRAYGGQTVNFGEKIAYRACYSKDKTGQTILHSLYNEAQKFGINFFSEFFVFDLLTNENRAFGCLALSIASGAIHVFLSPSTIIATGGFSQIYKNTTSSQICTGDGNALILKAGLALQDMEFVQFHPTGIASQGFLISEAARGEGAYLLNSNGDRFMKNYAPKMMELASRDIISRAIAHEIAAGRGCGQDKNGIHLDLRHLSPETLSKKLPGIVEVAKNFARIDVHQTPILVAPTAHYTMGGIAVDIDCNVIDFSQNKIHGLFAIGETACLSVHGANRLGCNSLLDLIVFGEIAGKNATLAQENFAIKNEIIIQKILNFEENFFRDSIGNSIFLSSLKSSLQEVNEKFLGVFRDEKSLKNGLTQIQNLQNEFENYAIKNKSLIFNDEIVLYFELENLLLNSVAAFFCAIARQESRGAHFREDYPQKNDEIFHHHSLFGLEEGVGRRKIRA